MFIKLLLKKISGFCGILIPIVIFINIGIAIFYSPWFNWTKNALSDLGIEGISAFFFNNGMILGGILVLIFSIGLVKRLEVKTGGYVLFLSSIALIGIGVFPETMFTIHWIFSALFFITLTIALLIIGITLRKNQSERTLGSIATIFSILSFCSLMLIFPWEGIAIPESISCFPAFVWFMIYGAKMTLN